MGPGKMASERHKLEEVIDDFQVWGEEFGHSSLVLAVISAA